PRTGRCTEGGEERAHEADPDDRDVLSRKDLGAAIDVVRARQRLARKWPRRETGGQRHRLAGLDEIIRGVGVFAEHRDALPHLQRGHPGSDGIDDAPRFVARISGWKGITEPRAPFPWGNVRRTDT